jgi:hypothetical protein
MRGSIVVKKDTASCVIVYGSSRSKINRETIMRRSAPPISDVGSTKRQGFQHISQVASEFKNALLDGNRGMTLRLVEDLEKEGYTFVFKDDSVWKETPREKVMTRVRTSLTVYRKTRAKRKAVHMSTSDVDKEETTCADARNAEEFQSRTFRNAATNVFILPL